MKALIFQAPHQAVVTEIGDPEIGPASTGTKLLRAIDPDGPGLLKFRPALI